MKAVAVFALVGAVSASYGNYQPVDGGYGGKPSSSPASPNIPSKPADGGYGKPSSTPASPNVPSKPADGGYGKPSSPAKRKMILMQA